MYKYCWNCKLFDMPSVLSNVITGSVTRGGDLYRAREEQSGSQIHFIDSNYSNLSNKLA